MTDMKIITNLSCKHTYCLWSTFLARLVLLCFNGFDQFAGDALVLAVRMAFPAWLDLGK